MTARSRGYCRRQRGAGARQVDPTRGDRSGSVGKECETNIARPASSAAVKVPMKAACTNGTDLRKVLRIDCSRAAGCYN